MLRIEGSPECIRCTCVNRPSHFPDEQFRTHGSAHRAYLAAVQGCFRKIRIAAKKSYWWARTGERWEDP